MRRLPLYGMVYLMAACTDQSTVRVVSRDEYGEIDRCWTQNTENVAFVILHKVQSGVIPYFVSPICDLPLGGFPEGAGFLGYLNAVPITGDHGALMRRGLLDSPLQPNTVDHPEGPEEYDPIYVWRGHLKRRDADGYVYYDISEGGELKDVSIRLAEFRRMTPSERLILFERS